MTDTGKVVRLGRLMRNGRTVLVPLDDALISGPFGGLRDGRIQVRNAVAGRADAVMGFRGLMRRCVAEGIRAPFIANLTASTIHGDHTKKYLVSSVEAAVADGCDGVSAHVNLSAHGEGQMMASLGAVGEACDRWGIPLVAIMYPRKAGLNGIGDDNYFGVKSTDRQAYADLIAHAVRIGVELGADVVKTQYSGDPESFSTVVEAACGVPVVVAGGELVAVEQAIENAHGAMLAGAAGVCFGRNVYNRTDPAALVAMLVSIVHHGGTPSQVLAAAPNQSLPPVALSNVSGQIQRSALERGNQ